MKQRRTGPRKTWMALACGTVAVVSACGAQPLPRDLRDPPEHRPAVRPAAIVPHLSLVTAGLQNFATPLAVKVAAGTLTSMSVTGPLGNLAGTLSPAGWISTGVLAPSAAYQLVGQATDLAGVPEQVTLDASTTAVNPERVLSAVLSPGDDAVVGVGSPLIVQLNRPVSAVADQRALVARLTVTTSPPVDGAWRFVSATELHYRPAQFWAAGTQVSLASDLSYLELSDGVTWGSLRGHRIMYRIGSALVSTVDLSAHTMTVRRDGAIMRVLKISGGRPEYPTKGGVHIVLAKTAMELFDSATVGIPRRSPAGYFEELPWSERISNGGAFVHANPFTVAAQGVSNVSHGCVNLALADAEWFFGQVRLGDVVTVIDAVVPPVLEDPGMMDWNVSFKNWPIPTLPVNAHDVQRTDTDAGASTP